eukprot:scaffold141973_cov31-Tisochrysis_lutea.AAC.4
MSAARRATAPASETSASARKVPVQASRNPSSANAAEAGTPAALAKVASVLNEQRVSSCRSTRAALSSSGASRMDSYWRRSSTSRLARA